VERAQANKGIEVHELVCVLAVDEKYTSLLPGIWQKFQLDFDGDNISDIDFPSDRVDIWSAILHRWTHNEVFGIKAQRGGPKKWDPLPLYNQDLSPYDFKDGADCAVIKLDDLHEWFTKKYKIPLPTKLFPDSKSEATSDQSDSPSGPLDKEPPAAVPEEILDRDQQLKIDAEKCYRVYKRLLNSDELNRDRWAKEVDKIKLKYITAEHIQQIVQIHYAPKNRKKQIISNLVKIATKP